MDIVFHVRRRNLVGVIHGILEVVKGHKEVWFKEREHELKNEIHKGKAELVKCIVRDGIIVHSNVKLRMICQKLEIILEYKNHIKILNIIQSQLYIIK